MGCSLAGAREKSKAIFFEGHHFGKWGGHWPKSKSYSEEGPSYCWCLGFCFHSIGHLSRFPLLVYHHHCAIAPLHVSRIKSRRRGRFWPMRRQNRQSDACAKQTNMVIEKSQRKWRRNSSRVGLHGQSWLNSMFNLVAVETLFEINTFKFLFDDLTEFDHINLRFLFINTIWINMIDMLPKISTHQCLLNQPNPRINSGGQQLWVWSATVLAKLQWKRDGIRRRKWRMSWWCQGYWAIDIFPSEVVTNFGTNFPGLCCNGCLN